VSRQMQSHRRHHHGGGPVSSSVGNDTSAQFQPPGLDDPDRKYRKPKSLSRKRQLLQIFLAVAFGMFVLGQRKLLAPKSGTRGAEDNTQSASPDPVDEATSKTIRAPERQAVLWQEQQQQRKQPDWIRNLQPLPTPAYFTDIAADNLRQRLQDPGYGNEQMTGRYRFADSKGCASASNTVCVLYLPEVDLQQNISPDEALAVQASMLRGMGKGLPVVRPPPVMGSSVIIADDASLRIDEDHAVLTRAGFNGHVNQDRSVIVAPYCLETDAKADADASSRDNDFLMALFDGHGDRGQVTSELAVRTFPALLAKHIESSVPSNAQGDGFDENKLREAVTMAYQEIDDVAASVSGAGCTATSVLRVGNRLYHINTGDSQSFLGYFIRGSRGDAATTGVAFLTKEHKPHLPEEKARIESMGGTVMLPPPAPPGIKMALSSRVLALLPNGMQLGLAMSRSLGDVEAGNVGVIATPEITTLNLLEIREEIAAKYAGADPDDIDLFVVVASDGIFDHVEPAEVARVLASALFRDGDGAPPPPPGKDKWTLLMAVENIIMTASQRWLENLDQAYRDDISLAVSKVII